MPADETRSTLLVVDDVIDNIDLLRAILEPYYVVKVAKDGERALKIVMSSTPPDLILLDVQMPGIDGYEVCRQVKSRPDREHIPIVFVTAMDELADEEYGLSMGACDYIVKPFSPAIVLARVKTHLALYNHTKELERQVQVRTHELQMRTRELQHTRLEIIHRLGRAAEFRDNETGLHVVRMAYFSRLIALHAGLGEAFAEDLFLAAPMHDVGKIGTPDYVLLKPGKLTPEEWTVMQLHAQSGAEIIGDHEDEMLSMAKSIALSHHEKWDGSGYPKGLSGTNIPLVGRIVAYADVYDALTSVRPYKVAWPSAKAVSTIEQDCGRHFDPGLLGAFLAALPEMLLIQERYADEDAKLRTLNVQERI